MSAYEKGHWDDAVEEPVVFGPLHWHREPGVAIRARLLSLFSTVLEGYVRSNRDEVAKALYDERRKLLAGLMMSEAEPWEDLPEDVKERWRSKLERPRASEHTNETETHS